MHRAHELAELRSLLETGCKILSLRLRNIVLHRTDRNQVADLKILHVVKLCKLANHVERERVGHDAIPIPIKITIAPQIVSQGGTSCKSKKARNADPMGSANDTIAT